MANYVIYTRIDGTELKLKIDSERTIELEEKLGGSIFDKLADTNKLSVAVEFIAAAIPEISYQDRRKTALAIYDEIIESGKKYRDYIELIHKVCVNSGFLDGGTVEKQIELQKAQDNLEKIAYEAQLKLIAEKTGEIEAKNAPADTEVSQS